MMTEQEIIDALRENDLRAIRAIIAFLAEQTDQEFIRQIKTEQDSLRAQLAEVRNAPSN